MMYRHGYPSTDNIIYIQIHAIYRDLNMFSLQVVLLLQELLSDKLKAVRLRHFQHWPRLEQQLLAGKDGVIWKC